MAITFVGGQDGAFAGTTANQVINFALTGGSDAALIAGDLVIVGFAAGSTIERTTMNIRVDATGPIYTYASGAKLYADDSSDVNGSVGYRFMPSPPETSFMLAGGSGNTADAAAWTCHVFRGVDPTTPMDVAEVVATGANSRVANPAAITPVTPGAVIYVYGAGAGATGGIYTAGYLNDFRAATQIDNTDVNIGAGYLEWDGSGAYNPASFGGGGTSTTADSWAALTLVLRPLAAEVVGSLDVTLADVWLTSTGTVLYAYDPPVAHKGQIYLSDVLSDGVFATTVALSENSAQTGGV
jgi:hypothetical protein